MATPEEALSITRSALRRHVAEARDIQERDHIQDDLGLDSLAVMEVIAEIEERVHVTIPSEALAELATVGDVARAISRLSTPAH